MLHATVSSVETKSSWVVASMILVVMAVAFGAPWITIVALKELQPKLAASAQSPHLPAP